MRKATKAVAPIAFAAPPQHVPLPLTEPEPAPAKKSAASPEPAEAALRIGGVLVVTDEPDRSPLSDVWGKFIPFAGRRRYVLEDGSEIFGCADCAPGEVTGTRGDIMVHRVQQHGATKPGSRNTAKAKAKEPEGEPDSAAPAWMGMTMGEVVELAYHLTGAEAEADHWREKYNREHEQRMAAEAEVRKFKRAFTKLGFTPATDGN